MSFSCSAVPGSRPRGRPGPRVRMPGRRASRGGAAGPDLSLAQTPTLVSQSWARPRALFAAPDPTLWATGAGRRAGGEWFLLCVTCVLTTRSSGFLRVPSGRDVSIPESASSLSCGGPASSPGPLRSVPGPSALATPLWGEVRESWAAGLRQRSLRLHHGDLVLPFLAAFRGRGSLEPSRTRSLRHCPGLRRPVGTASVPVGQDPGSARKDLVARSACCRGRGKTLPLRATRR